MGYWLDVLAENPTLINASLNTTGPFRWFLYDALRDNKPLEWTRVNDLPDFVYFSHKIHIHQGVGCATCHGRVDKMPLLVQAAPLLMGWCLDCHRAPEKYLRPREEVFNMAYEAPANQLELGRQLKAEYHVASVEHLTSCSVCHR